jgi:hypothetical protein
VLGGEVSPGEDRLLLQLQRLLLCFVAVDAIGAGFTDVQGQQRLGGWIGADAVDEAQCDNKQYEHAR